MRYLFELSGEHPDLPIWEAQSLLECSGKAELLDRDYNLAIFSSRADQRDFSDRIAMSHYLSEHLGSVDSSDLVRFFQGLDLPRGESISVKVKVADPEKGKHDPVELTRKIGEAISGRVRFDLDDPSIRYRVVIGKQAYVGKVIEEIDRTQYEKRKNRFLPFNSPISIHPRLARTLVNLAAMSSGCSILDPFCGTGALLIESALMGMNVYGSDLSQDMVDGSKKNLEKLGLAAKLRRLDIGDISGFGKKFDCIVTDPPYGRSSSTNKEPLGELYARALDSFSRCLVSRGRVGIIVPDLKMLKPKSDFEVVRMASVRAHRSLTRHFVVLERT